MIARDLRDSREKRDWSEVSSLRVAPVAHGLLVSLMLMTDKGPHA
jgi:hypothetical protein